MVVTPDECKRILARFKVHFPTFLPADPTLARAAAEDWIRVMAPCPPEFGSRAADMIVKSWHAKDGAPRIADWLDVTRPMLVRGMVGALELPESPQTRETESKRRLEHVRQIKEAHGWVS